ncbi:hypothetical protein O9992_16330 [Vibrio lentus]|nr:hypothetical protein [Vibrio lentus]
MGETVVDGGWLLIGVLVSLIKISALADVSWAFFWAFAIYAMLVVKTMSLVDSLIDLG